MQDPWGFAGRSSDDTSCFANMETIVIIAGLFEGRTWVIGIFCDATVQREADPWNRVSSMSARWGFGCPIEKWSDGFTRIVIKRGGNRSLLTTASSVCCSQQQVIRVKPDKISMETSTTRVENAITIGTVALQ